MEEFSQGEEEDECDEGDASLVAFGEGFEESSSAKPEIPEPIAHDPSQHRPEFPHHDMTTGAVDGNMLIRSLMLAMEDNPPAEVCEHLRHHLPIVSSVEQLAKPPSMLQALPSRVVETHVKGAVWTSQAIGQIRVLAGQPAAPRFGFTSHNLTHWVAGYRAAVKEVLGVLERLEEEEARAVGRTETA